jgi:pimeloyl-ACP methyl ester carboxylesterase
MIPFRRWMLVAMLLGIQFSGVCCLVAVERASQVVRIRGVNIHFLVEGKGEPVILIHGLHSSAEINWKRTGIFAELAKDHQVIALDLPGHGLSNKPDREQAYGLQVVEDVVGVLDHLKIKRAHIVGYSLGGMVVVKLLAVHPERALSATIGGMGWLREGSRLQKVWEQMPAREGARTPAAFVHSIGKLAVSEEELRRIDLPVKVVVGDHDPVGRLYVTPLGRVRPDWPVVEIADAGHLSCIVKPQFRDEIVDWVRKHTRHK